MNDFTHPVLPDGTLVGKNHIQRYLWSTDLGTVYEITIGTTSHMYGLLVLDPAVAAIGPDALHATLAPAIAATNPCLAKPYACGQDDGHLWIRMELTDSIAISRFDNAQKKSSHADDEEEEDEDRIEDASELLAAYDGTLPQSIFHPILGDLIEGLAAVHAAGGVLGPLSLQDIGFSHWLRHSGFPIVAKWCNFGMLELRDPSASWTPQDDFRMLAGLARALLFGKSSQPRSEAIWPEWEKFLETAERPDGFADDAALKAAYDAILAAHDGPRPPRIRPEDTIAPLKDVTARTRRPGSSSRSHSHRRHRSRRSRRFRQPQELSSKILLFIAAVAAIGIVIVTLRPNLIRIARDRLHGVRSRPAAKTAAGGSSRTNATVVATADVLRLPFESLEIAAQNSANLPARMAYALALASGDDGREPNPERAEEIAQAAFTDMEARTNGVDLATDRVCEFWTGYALLTGLGTVPDTARAVLLLDRAESIHNDLNATSLLADYYASGAEDGPSHANDEEALSRWFKIIDSEPGQRLSANARQCADKIAAFYFAERGIPTREQDRYVAHLESIARRGHIPTILALGHIYLQGRIANINEADAKKWYSEAARLGSPEGMYHNGWLIERGIASAPSDRAAATWYRRAAIAGNADAMRALARLLREKRVRSEDSDEPLSAEGGRTADEWEAAAESEAHAPTTLPFTTWWLGRQAIRFPAPEPARLQ